MSNQNEKCIKPYSKALLELGLNFYLEKDTSNPHEFYQIIFDMEKVLTILNLTPGLEKYLSNPVINITDKITVLKKSCFTEKTSKITEQFLILLITKKRIKYLKSILQRFLKKSYLFIRLKFIKVYSVVPLNHIQKNEIRNYFTKEKSFFSKVSLIHVIDKEILGGIIINTNSLVIDLSLRRELNLLLNKIK
uniref:CF1 subunit delta n=1 Tax=Phaeophyceae sp. TaxID=2249243 RepID=A0A8E5BGU0_9PHAE|nr:CF1 subunit delta [Phaeophyceae sp.]